MMTKRPSSGIGAPARDPVALWMVLLGLAVLALGVLPVPGGAQEEALTDRDYRKAEQLLDWNVEELVRNHEVSPNWIHGEDHFWYRVPREEGHEFVFVDPVQREQRPAFDHGALASAMSVAADTSYSRARLPFETFEYLDEDLEEIEIKVDDRRFECDLRAYDCHVGDTLEKSDESFVMSPDSTREAFVHEHDLWVRSVESGDSIQLTEDGERFWAYGLREPRFNEAMNDEAREPDLRWAPDSRHLAVKRWDERDVEHMPMYSVTSIRPKEHSYPYALPGDSIYPIGAVHVVDVEAEANHRVELEPDPAFLDWASGMDSTWTDGAESVRLISTERGHSHAQLVEVQADDGNYDVLAEESYPTFVDLAHRGPPNWYAGDDDVIWFSQRDGWGHLYRYDRDGNLLNRITEGPWTVGHIQHVDEDEERILFTAWGREEDRKPYFTHFYGVDFDGSNLELLTPDDAFHEVEVSPSGEYFIHTRSSRQETPTTVVRSTRGGDPVMELEEANLDDLLDLGWSAPETFRVKGRDGVTDIYGIIHKPSDFDANERYPVVNYIYPGPQIGSVGSWDWTLGSRGNARALAELGFVVVKIEHMGTPFRSKDFHDRYYGDMADHGLPDHVAALRQLASQRRYMDLDRVGIYGHSGGGFASTAAILQYPDVFHVAVSTAGNHDNRRYGIHWGEKYQGLLEEKEDGGDNYESQANQNLVDNLEGDLLLMTGDLDDNVHPAMTYKVVYELIEANKDFDFILLPDRAHGLNEPYVIRRTWDYFVENLLGKEAPDEFLIREADDDG